MLNRNLIAISALALAFAPFVTAQDSEHSHYYPAATPEPMQQYTETDLVSNISGQAAVTDPNLLNPWGLSRSSNGDWWVADNTSGLSTLYNGAGEITPLVVTIPPSNPSLSSTGTPTGTIFNGTTDFAVAAGKPAIFLFCTEDGTISGWNPGANPTVAVIAVNEGQKSVFKGMTMGQALIHGKLVNLLYVADFRAGKVQVYDSTFHHVSAIEEAFKRNPAPEGYAPFNVQNLGGNIYVALAKQDAAKHDEVHGSGLGFVAALRPDGTLIQIMQPGLWLNAPWGVAIAPSDFGAYSHDVLVGNFGSGEIVVFDPITGAYKGKLRDANSKAFQIHGLWGLSFGNGTGAGSAISLYFGAGPHFEQDGLFGTITAIQNTAGNDN